MPTTYHFRKEFVMRERLDEGETRIFINDNFILSFNSFFIPKDIIEKQILSRVKQCLRPDCQRIFYARNRHQKYCSPRCTWTENTRRSRSRPSTLKTLQRTVAKLNQPIWPGKTTKRKNAP